MDIFFNDCLLRNELLDKHLNDVEALFSSIKDFSLFCDVIKDKKLEYGNQMNLNFYASETMLKGFFEFISNRDLEYYFRDKISKIKPVFWDSNSIQDNQIQYYFLDSTDVPPKTYDINNTSLAEATEYLCKYENSTLALNFPDSVLSNHKSLIVILVKTQSTSTKSIACADSVLLLDEWINQNIDTTLFLYNKKSTDPPTDLQTCLRSRIRFEDTGELYNNVRKIYRDKETNNKWYVDNFHYGEKSHIEVFDSTGNKFIGEATIDGMLIPKIENAHNKSKSQKKKEKRRLRK